MNIVAFKPLNRMASVEARIRLIQKTRMFASASERLKQQELEWLRSEDHAAIKRWLEGQMVVEPVKPQVSMKVLDYLIGLLLFAGGVISILFVAAMLAVMLER